MQVSVATEPVLIIDDSDEKRYVTRRLLNKAGFTTREARTGEEALELLHPANEAHESDKLGTTALRPWLVVSDIQLPGMDGMDVCRRIKADKRTSSLMVLLYSTYRVSSTDFTTGMYAGADGYLIDSVESDVFVAYVRFLQRLAQSQQEKEWLLAEQARLLAELQEAAAKQRRFLREMLRGFTEGKLYLCDEESDLPAALPQVTPMLELTAQTLRPLRKQMTAIAEALDFPLERRQDLETGVGEAAMNAVRHAGGGSARICWDAGTGIIQVWVQDAGPGIAEDLIHRAVERNWTTGGFGQGFWLMLKTCDQLYLLTGASGTTVVLQQGRAEPTPAWLEGSGTGGEE